MNTLIDGQTAYVYTGGRPLDTSKPCLVFIHGALHDHSVWTLLARWFAHHGYTVVAPDLPGHGRSAGEATADIQAGGAWVLRLLDQLGIAKAAIIGHSMGSLIALEAAAQAPTRCQQLCLIGSAYPMRVSPALLEMAKQDAEAAMKMVNTYSHSDWAPKPSYPGPGMSLHGANLQLMRRIQSGYAHGNLFTHDFRICDSYAGGAEAASKLACGVDVVIGARDQMTTAKQGVAWAQSLGAHVHTLPCGHALMSEAPDPLLQTLRQILAQSKGA